MIVRLDEAADALGVSIEAVRGKLDRGELRGRRTPGGRWNGVTLRSVLELLDVPYSTAENVIRERIGRG